MLYKSSLIKDLKVKGSSMVAKQGTAVRNIRLDHENAEYIEGKVFEDLLVKDRYKFSKGEIYRIGSQLLELIEILHNKNIVHRDIRLPNVILKENNELALIDFGLARIADNKKYVSLISSEDFACSIEAFTYPEKFAECDGSAEAMPGVKVYQQKRNTFGLSYQTQLGNDLAQQDFGYMIHLVYGCTTAPSERAYQTINESPEAMTLSWEISTSAVEVPGFKPSARLSINSTKVDIAKLKALEDILYGTELVEARLPLPAEVFTLINTAG